MFRLRSCIAAAATSFAFALPASATVFEFSASLTGAKESPPNEIFVGLSGPATGSHTH